MTTVVPGVRHSLGGALATLCAMEIVNSRRVPRLQLRMYNYGSPRVGNSAFAAKYNELVTDSFRLVNESDVVPSIPALLGRLQDGNGCQ